MKTFDFNIHLPDLNEEGVNARVGSEMNSTNEDLIERVKNHYSMEEITGGNFMIFNPNFYHQGSNFNSYVKEKLEYSAFTLLVDFRDSNVYKSIDKAIFSGINCIKFHSYHQKISRNDYSKIIEICKYAEKKQLIICLDASYGTSNMRKYDIVDFICSVANEIHNTPLVVLHSGGLKCLEIMLLALDKNNIWVEMSLSLPIYMGSSIEQDLAFMYKNLDSEKILWATDSPYIPFDKMKKSTEEFLDKHNFSQEFKENVYFNNAINLLKRKH